MIVNNYTTETMSDIFVKYDEAIQSYNVLPLPLANENEDLNFLNEIYYNDLCTNSNHFVCEQK